jgi:hypothetical protein
MDAGIVKGNLLKLHAVKEDFTVEVSEKENKAANGTYTVPAKKITVYGGNFKNEASLMATAVHELAHHILYTEYGRKSGRAHSKLFWATYHDLLDKAEESGVYAPEISGEVRSLIEEAKGISEEIALLQRKLGGVLARLAEVCEREGVRFEEAAERGAQISRESCNEAMAACRLGEEGLGMDIQRAAVKANSCEKREKIIQAGKEGKSAAQAKQAADGRVRFRGEMEVLKQEKTRIERTINVLKRRLEGVIKNIERLSGGGGGVGG